MTKKCEICGGGTHTDGSACDISFSGEMKLMKEIVMFTEDDVLEIVDSCFHAYASDFRIDARELAQEIMNDRLWV